jgi:hypothetical protein
MYAELPRPVSLAVGVGHCAETVVRDGPPSRFGDSPDPFVPSAALGVGQLAACTFSAGLFRSRWLAAALFFESFTVGVCRMTACALRC